MRQRFTFFLVVLLLIFSGEIRGQGGVYNSSEKKPVGQFTSYLSFVRKAVSPGTGQQQSLLQYGQRRGSFIKYPVEYGAMKAFDFEKQLPVNSWPVRIQSIITQSSFTLLSKPVLEPCYYTSKLGFFCQKELQIQKLTSLPVYFRLGSMDYVNYMEQKPNAVKPR